MTPAARDTLIRTLADGGWHDAADLARIAGVPARSLAEALQAAGLAAAASEADRWRLSAPLDLLDADEIGSQLSAAARCAVSSLNVQMVVDSTSDFLARLPPAETNRARVCLAEYQTRGRGRHSRRWIAALGAGICLSCDWTFAEPPSQLACLGLAVGVVAVEALAALGVTGLGLKWPNDILMGANKLGGVLIDAQGTARGPCRVVVGLGLNHRLCAADRDAIATLGGRPADLADACDGRPPARSAVAAALINALAQLMPTFAAGGGSSWIPRWRTLDALRGQRIDVQLAGQPICGVAAGIDDDGALLIHHDSGLRRIVAGEVTVRPSDRAAD